jgi:hypothetical protein
MIFKPRLALGALLGIALAVNNAFAAQPKVPSAPPPRIAPLADKLLTNACQMLSSAQAFSFHAEINFDQVLQSGVKLQFAGAMDFGLQRPGELAVYYQSDLGAKRLWFQNGTLTIFDPPHMVYATVTGPPTIDGMLEQAATRNHLTVPLSEFAYSDPCKKIRERVIFGAYVGVNDVNGVACDHIAFSSAQVDLQLWLQHSGKPVPRKIVINYRTDPGSPEYVAVLSDWKFPSSIPASMFRPQLPKTAKHIDILKVKEAKP